ncbi:hypothetical protein DACRYDRAFT_116327 [Dacryopinax primogenitus]|uniref:Adipose-regulatory protein n=1 Tax=Dacryopinax primogenitus (strain DJM 731) TaxID=1858805 RepID=M5G156_DACPD|nr:uncharacterized protein DACRYDRAFT_116327 [Dacryopinax primogenitus]EJU01905.1 hypothetical protein DACRYDRAFT_116327 [Dacryopinax primogenitus]
MCNMTLIGRSGTSISSSRPYIFLPPLPFFNIWPRSRSGHMVLPMMESVLLSTLGKPITARIEIGRQDAWRSLGSRREVQTVSAELRVAAVLRGLRWWMFKYPITSITVSTVMFFLAACLIASVTYVMIAPPLILSLSNSSITPQGPIKAVPSSSSEQTNYQASEIREEATIPLAREMVDVSVDPSIKSEDTEGEMSDWSDAVPVTGRGQTHNASTGTEGSRELRVGVPRNESTDSLSTLNGDVRRRLAQ